VPADQRGRGVFLAKSDGVIAGLPVAAAAFACLDPGISFEAEIEDGTWVESGRVFARMEGRLAPILSAERVALNFLQRLSGTATATRALTEAVAGRPVRVIDTRKTTPGLRELERYAVRCGGGMNHRFNLSDGILIKDNHIAAAEMRGLSLSDVINEAREGTPHTMRVEIEVESYAAALEAMEAGADIILLDNMTPEQMARVTAVTKGRCLTEASGGITIDNIRAIVDAGVDLISSGSITHSAKALDISLDIEIG
jgi:nicotinate-nucleotide pyrophosphorylase (carboxylating)